MIGRTDRLLNNYDSIDKDINEIDTAPSTFSFIIPEPIGILIAIQLTCE